jgi:hypothetical protein
MPPVGGREPEFRRYVATKAGFIRLVTLKHQIPFPLTTQGLWIFLRRHFPEFFADQPPTEAELVNMVADEPEGRLWGFPVLCLPRHAPELIGDPDIGEAYLGPAELRATGPLVWPLEADPPPPGSLAELIRSVNGTQRGNGTGNGAADARYDRDANNAEIDGYIIDRWHNRPRQFLRARADLEADAHFELFEKKLAARRVRVTKIAVRRRFYEPCHKGKRGPGGPRNPQR